MALIDEVRTRIGSARLIELTRANETTETATENTARLTAAVTDTEASFRTHTGVVLDDDDARHVALGVRGVLLHLQLWAEHSELAEASYRVWLEDLRQEGRQRQRQRIQPRVHVDRHIAYPTERRRTFGDDRHFPTVLEPPGSGAT